MNKKRYSILAKLRDERYFLLNFENQLILSYLDQIPQTNGLLTLANWPIYEPVEIEFFVELINDNVSYYHLIDRKYNSREVIVLDKKELGP
ncbi:hypothetical protein ACOQFO_09990 [Ureibacillus sp. MALMAid1270]|uniref:hypothetical protein n=1 Tax=Ureibacillus sp. MALMAid1270 TaxID=3411629 RepID=UPI003BA77848